MGNSEEYGEYSVDDETQLQPEDTLDGELGEDILDDGFDPPDRARGAQSFGVTVAEQRQGESLDQRLAQEEPEDTRDDDDSADDSAELDGSSRPTGRDTRHGRAPEEAALHLTDETD